MRIEPDDMHPTPVEEYSKMVMVRNAMLAVQARAAAAAAAGSVPVELTDDHREHHGPQPRMRGDNDSRLPLEVTRSAATPVACGGPLIPPTCGADSLGVQGERLMPGCGGEHHRGTGGLDGDLADPEARRRASGWPVFIRP
jgi:hypothetical protein